MLQRASETRMNSFTVAGASLIHRSARLYAGLCGIVDVSVCTTEKPSVAMRRSASPGTTMSPEVPSRRISYDACGRCGIRYQSWSGTEPGRVAKSWVWVVPCNSWLSVSLLSSLSDWMSHTSVEAGAANPIASSATRESVFEIVMLLAPLVSVGNVDAWSVEAETGSRFERD